MRIVRQGSWAWALVLGMALAAATPAGADFEVGRRAWDGGRPTDAVTAWRASAETGDGRSMLALGRAYAKGLGAPQDFVEAHKWLNLAAGLGSTEAAAERDALAEEMTAEERAEARKLARVWRNRVGQAASRSAPREAPAAEAPAGSAPKRAQAKATQGLKHKFPPGDKLRDCGKCPEMVIMPTGSFTMGSPASEEDRNDDEGPLRRVTISQPFAVGKYEVTFAEWKACVAGGGCNRHRPDDRNWGRGRRPVINVNWDDAKSYVAWLSRKTGRQYRLLTEPEWEYAARAGTMGRFHFGSTISTDRANYNGNYIYKSGGEGVYREQTVPVGSFPANDFGLHDIHGNVWEWVEDCWHNSYVGAPSDGSAWTTGGECGRRVLRGGSWYDRVPRNLRSADRFSDVTGVRSPTLGFRVARTLAP